MFHSGYGGEDMFIVVVYDVHKSRCAKVMKYLRQWLEHRQRSVFAGFLTESQVAIMYDGLLNMVNTKYDSIIVFQSNRANQVSEWNTAAAVQMRREGVLSHLKNDPGLSRPRRKPGKKKRSLRFKKQKSEV
ncbi:MAG: CRISPR-associated endonuclease Cas2 [Balneolia bacterium]|nr:CRISPR-associated endonuclease Cas2 [Balneolia bacterium]